MCCCCFDTVCHGFGACWETQSELVRAGDVGGAFGSGVKDAASGQLGGGLKKGDGADAFELGFVERSDPPIEENGCHMGRDGVGCPKVGPC